MNWVGLSKSGASIFHVEARGEREAKEKGREILKESYVRPLLKLWIRGGCTVKPCEEGETNEHQERALSN